MPAIVSSLEQRCKELSQEIATLQDYNRQWLEIQAAAETDLKRTEALNAIKTNNDLIGEKSLQVNEILQGRNPFDIQAVVTEPVSEPLADLTVEAKICKVKYFTFPFQNLLYQRGSLSITDSEVLLRPSNRRFSSLEPELVIIRKGQITSIDCDDIVIKIQTEANGSYTLWLHDHSMAAHLRYRLTGFFSETSTQATNDGYEFFENLKQTNKTAWVTPLLITINVAIFEVMVTQGYGFFSPEIQMASDWGANDGSLTLNGEWWRVITSMFLHYGVLHLVLNMNVLWVVGPMVERIFGSTKFLFLYFCSGSIAAFASLWYSPWKVGLGASGAIFGLIGGITAIAFIPKLRPPIFIAKKLISAGIFFVVINGAIGLAIPLADNAAHLGGIIGGAICGIILASSASSKTKNELNLALLLRLLCVTFFVGVACYFLLLNNASIQKDLQIKQSAALYEKAIKLLKDESYSESMTLARRAYELGNINSPNLIGYMRDRGLGVEGNPIEAADWFKKGVERGDPYAMMNLYKYYRSEKPVGVGFAEINNLLLAAVKKEHLPAHYQLELRFILLADKCGDQEAAQLSDAVYSGAEKNSPEMIALKGWLHYYGRCVKKDQDLGLKLLHQSYDLGARRAGDMLGRIYRVARDGQSIDLVLVQKFFATGAQKGDPRAQFELAVGYRDGLGVSKDVDKAKSWLKRAADQDYSPAKDALKQLE